MVHIFLLGCGFIGSAVLEGLLRYFDKHDQDECWRFTACVRSVESHNRLTKTFGQHRDSVKLIQGEFVHEIRDSDVVLLGCQPQDLESLISTPGLVDALDGKMAISMVAGTPVSRIREVMLDAGNRSVEVSVSRAIPTIGAKTGNSVTLLSQFPDDESRQQRFIEGMFNRIGMVEYVPEHLMNAATALGAASHALAIEAVEAMTDAGVAKGLPRSTAQSLAANCLQSASSLLAGHMSPETLKTAMSTPSGITLNSTLKLGRARTTISDTVCFAIDYANAMS